MAKIVGVFRAGLVDAVPVSIALTDTVSSDSTYKVGRQPPQFQRVSTVQTGLAFRF